MFEKILDALTAFATIGGFLLEVGNVIYRFVEKGRNAQRMTREEDPPEGQGSPG